MRTTILIALLLVAMPVGSADFCQIPTVAENRVTLPCLVIGGQLLNLSLALEQVNEAGENDWRSTGFEVSACQPTQAACATLGTQLQLTVPLILAGVRYTAQLDYHGVAASETLHWHYVSHTPQGMFDLKSKFLTNEAAYIPPQCYTKTLDDQDNTYNPCFTCHRQATAPNFINDGDLQTAYIFPTYARINRWHNLFKDRSQQVEAISDAEILAYSRVNNYQDAQNQLILTNQLKQLPAAWDTNDNGEWDGFLPDCYFNFDAQGFDRDPSGDYTGWRAFAYAPFPGTFWPTNGSTDDVLIRLPLAFRLNQQGLFDLTVYRLNLAIVEALIKRQDIAISPVDEKIYGVDLDKDGQLTMAQTIVYDWAPLDNRYMHYVGQAQQANYALAAGLFPLGTEFLHSVRYLDVDDQGEIRLAARMKELRYARKAAWRTYSSLEQFAAHEIKEDHDFPDRLSHIMGDMEHGVGNRLGWIFQGFIEDAQGQLRPQTYEEHVFCVGCHSTIGAITDGTFAFARKLPGESGWYHWDQQGLQGLAEPVREDGRYEFTFYLENNGAGDEFRANTEIIERFFDPEGRLKQDKLAALHQDIASLVLPSRQRALQLNKAYRVIVKEQSFREGRDATVIPPDNVHQTVKANETTGLTAID